jgi:hypothetical protein
MKSSEEKKRQKELLDDFKLKEKQAFMISLPFEKEKFQHLFDFLDEKLAEAGCDDTLLFTTEYLHENNLYSEEAIDFLEENGGYCDCGVLANVEEKFEGL